MEKEIEILLKPVKKKKSSTSIIRGKYDTMFWTCHTEQYLKVL